MKMPRPSDARVTATSAAGAAATATLAAVPGMSTYITAIVAGTAGATLVGTVTVLDDATPILVFPISANHPVVELTFDSAIQITRGNDVSVVVSAGGGALLSYANITAIQV